MAAGIMDHTARTLGRALAFAVTMLNPDTVVIGGGAAKAGERLLVPLREELSGRLLPAYMDGLTVVNAQLGDDAGIIGSALYATNRLAADRT